MMLRPALRTSHRSFCAASVGHLHHAAGQAEVAHQLHQLLQLRQQRGAVGAGELDQQDRLGPADQRLLDRRPERRVGQAQLDHRAVDQLDRGRAELDQVLRRVHGGAEGREVDDAQHLGARQLGEPERQAAREGQRALGADQQVRQVDAAVVGVGPLALRVEDVEVVAGDAAQHLRPALADLARVARGELAHEAGDGARAAAQARPPGRSRPACRRPARRSRRARCAPCCRRRSSASRTSCCRPCRRAWPARWSTRRPGTTGRAASAARSGGRARGPARPPRCARRRRRRARSRMCLLVSMTSAAPVVWPHWLVPPPRGSTGTRRSRAMSMATAMSLHRLRHEHADRHDLVDRRVGGVAAARGGVEQHLALGLGAQAPRQRLADVVGRAGACRRGRRARLRGCRPAWAGFGSGGRRGRARRKLAGAHQLEHRVALVVEVQGEDAAHRRGVARLRARRASPRARAPRASTSPRPGWSGSAATARGR